MSCACSGTDCVSCSKYDQGSHCFPKPNVVQFAGKIPAQPASQPSVNPCSSALASTSCSLPNTGPTTPTIKTCPDGSVINVNSKCPTTQQPPTQQPPTITTGPTTSMPGSTLSAPSTTPSQPSVPPNVGGNGDNGNNPPSGGGGDNSNNGGGDKDSSGGDKGSSPAQPSSTK